MAENIPFFKPEITKAEITAVTNVLKSGWLNTGQQNANFAEQLKTLTAAQSVTCTSSCWAGMLTMLHAFGVGLNSYDEVIVPNLTFTATASVVLQCGAALKLADVDGYHLCPNSVARLLSKRTKAVIAVDYGGYPANYQALLKLLKNTAFSPSCSAQEKLGRPLLMADAAHSIGSYPIKKITDQKITNPPKPPKPSKGIKIFLQSEAIKKKYAMPPAKALPCDVAVYSFHTVKNITTGDGGAVAIFNKKLLPLEKILRLSINHGMNKSAFWRHKAANKTNTLNTSLQVMPHRYDVLLPGNKFNLTDIAASLGLAQLARLAKITTTRHLLVGTYIQLLTKHGLGEQTNNGLHNLWLQRQNGLPLWHICPHLFTIRLKNLTQQQKVIVFSHCQKAGIALNEHYKPLSLLSVYKRTAKANTAPQSLQCYYESISLPFYNTLKNKQISYIVKTLVNGLRKANYLK